MVALLETENVEVPKEKNKKRIVYTAEFIDEGERAELLRKFPPIHDKVYATHITVVFNPKNGPEGVEIGREGELEIIGYVEDENGQAVLVKGSKSTKEHPHITISCAPDTEPKYSNEMISRAITNGTVKYFEEPFTKIKVVEGYTTGGITRIIS